MEREFAQVRAAVFEPYTLFRVRPLSGRYVNVTAHGYRCGGGTVVWPPDTQATNLFVFGGSTAFGYVVADAETIPAQLAAHCAAALPGQAITVYNFASPNYVSVQERIRLEQLILTGAVPHVAIFIDGFDEFIAPYYAPRMFAPFEEALPPRTTWQQVLRLLHQCGSRRLPGWLRAQHNTAPSTASSPDQLPDPTTVLECYMTNTRLIKAICASCGIQPLFVWQPVPCYRYEGAAGQPHTTAHGDSAPLLACVRHGYQLMSTRRLTLSDKEFLWLADMQVGRGDNLYVDADHYTPAFSRDIASLIARHLCDTGFLEQRNATC